MNTAPALPQSRDESEREIDGQSALAGRPER